MLFKKPKVQREIPELTDEQKQSIIEMLLNTCRQPGNIAHHVGCHHSRVEEVKKEVLRIKSEMDKLTPGYQLNTARQRIKSDMLNATVVIDDIVDKVTEEGTWGAYQDTKRL